MSNLTVVSTGENSARTGPRILIVDDDPDSAEITARLISSGGSYRLTCVHDAEAAYTALKLADDIDPDSARASFDLVVMDIMMPGVDGIEATAAIRTTRRGASVPILMLSGRRDLALLGQAFMAGASDFVAKPVEAVDLQARVRTLLRLKREQDRRQARERQLVASNRELQHAVIDGTLFDSGCGLPSRAWAELVLRDCRKQDRPVAAALVQVDELDAYINHHGTRASESLLREIAGRLREVPAPLCASIALWDDGRFLVLAPGHRDAARLGELCANLQRAVEYPAIPHGNALHHDRVRISTASAWRPALQAADLPSALIASLGLENFQGRRHVELAWARPD
ncbi:response regulator [Croceicoccus bisphenolivorans]|uniref:response regulator n=1 Tax=Croceicoccus bisphenolivorans TaxID=1783232 RepID=UPI0008305D09|nr:response regulator [Croceicoccus bisphenolivorans]